MEIVFIGLALSVCCFGIWRYGKTLRRGGCCGSGAVSPVKRRVADRDETHYPYTAVLTIDGMTCGHCAVRVENALNELNGVWAKVDLGGKTALVRMVQPLPEAVLRQAIRGAGYTLLHINWKDPLKVISPAEKSSSMEQKYSVGYGMVYLMVSFS